MLAKYHLEITTNALESSFSSGELQTVIQANIGQDKLINLIIHPEYHFDNNLFTEAYTYLEQQRQVILATLNKGDQQESRKAFGRLIHGAQDFYAHSNYVELWLEMYNRKEENTQINPRDIDPLNVEILNNPGLYSGRVYYLRDAISYIPGLKKFIKRISPPDSHTHMNLDAPDKECLFPYAYSAAQKRTLHEFKEVHHLILTQFGPDDLARFTGNQPPQRLQDTVFLSR